MIFCFSGTGNSLHVAKVITKQNGDEIVMMTEAELLQEKTYSLQEGERLGFVFPIYWWGIPTQVKRFVEHMKLSFPQLSEQHTYTYAYATYGMVGNNGMRDIRKCLERKHIDLDAAFEVKMVDNYIIGYELANKEKQKALLEKAEIQIQEDASSIARRQKQKIKDYLWIFKPIVHKCYQSTNHAKKFFVTEDCINCGRCRQKCPSNAIERKNDKLVWSQDCTFCLKCIHNCPKQAIQYGKTQGRTRYGYKKSENRK